MAESVQESSEALDKGGITLEDLLTHGPWLHRLALSLVDDPNVAEDLLQETWVASLLHPPRTASAPRAWLAKVLKNFARQHARRERVRIALPVESTTELGASPPARELAQRSELQKRIAVRIQALAEPYRTVILLRFYGEHSASEIALRRNTTAGTVRSQLKRCLDQLRGDLDREYAGDRRAWALLLRPDTRGSFDRSVDQQRVGEPHRASGSRVRSQARLAVGLLLVVLMSCLTAWFAMDRTGASPELAAAEAVGEHTKTQADPLPEIVRSLVTESSFAPTRAASVAEAPRSDRRLEILVVDNEGHSVAGARIFLDDFSSPRTEKSFNRRLRGDTDPYGRLELDLEQRELGTPAEYGRLIDRAGVLATAADGAASPKYHVECPPGESRSLKVTLGSSGLTLRGRVVDANGHGVPEACVEAGGSSSEWRQAGPGIVVVAHRLATTTDAEGAFELPHLECGRNLLEVHAASFVPASQWEDSGSRSTHDCVIRLDRGGSVTGSVWNQTGQVVPGALVWSRCSKFCHELETRADEQGCYRLSGVHAGCSQLLWALDPLHDNQAASVQQNFSEGPEVRWDAILEEREPVRVRFLDEAGAPIVGWPVCFGNPARSSDGWRRLSSDEHGRVVLHDGPEQPVAVHLLSPGESSFSRTFGPVSRSAREFVFTAARSGPVHNQVLGSVFDERGQVPPRASLGMRNLETELLVEIGVDPASGAFEQPVETGAYQVHAMIGARGYFELGRHEVTATEPLDLGSIRAPAPGSLRVDWQWPGSGCGRSLQLLHLQRHARQAELVRVRRNRPGRRHTARTLQPLSW